MNLMETLYAGEPVWGKRPRFACATELRAGAAPAAPPAAVGISVKKQPRRAKKHFECQETACPQLTIS